MMWPRLKATLSARRVEIALVALLWLTYAYFYQSTQHNGAARLDQTRAIVEDGVLYIDRFRYNTADVISFAREGEPAHVYPNKAPGTSLLAVVPFWFWMHALGIFGFQEWAFWHAVAYATILTTVGLLSALSAVAMFAILRRLTGESVFAALAVAAIWLGTICFPFSTLFFSHQQAAAQLVLAFYFLFRFRNDGPSAMRHAGAKMALAGFLCGFTVATEYPTVLLVALLCAYFASTLARAGLAARQRLAIGASFAGGLAAGMLILVCYNLSAFGKVFFIPYQAYAREATSSPFPGHRAGFVGVHWPGWHNFVAVLKEITLRPQRGLLYLGLDGPSIYACNPVLWLALPGLLWLLWARWFRTEAVLVAAMTVAYLTFNACYGDSIVYWGGAWSVGPRHLIPLLPFLALPLVEGARRLWWLFVPLLLLSVFYMLLATAVEPRVPYEYRNPARDLFLQKYLEGHLALNRQGLFDISSRPLAGDSTAFNLGKLAGLPGTVQLVPLLAIWLLAGTVLIRSAWSASRDPGRNTGQGEVHAGRDEQTRQEGGGWRRAIAAVLKPRFSPHVATAVLAAYVVAIAAAPPIHAARVKRQLARGGGLLGKYYANTNWSGPPAFVRKDRLIDFNWTLDPPLPGRFSVEWTGTIRIDRPGRYVFATESDDGSFLAIAGKVVVDNGGRHPPRYRAGQIAIRRPGVFPILIRYFNAEGGGMIRAMWRRAGEADQLIPAELLSPPGVEDRRQ